MTAHFCPTCQGTGHVLAPGSRPGVVPVTVVCQTCGGCGAIQPLSIEPMPIFPPPFVPQPYPWGPTWIGTAPGPVTITAVYGSTATNTSG